MSAATCEEAEILLDQGADDDQMVVAVGRYTVENLILNEVHEIGEWLRFDGRRVFPAHASAGATAAPDGQGNGPVQLTVAFLPPTRPTPALPAREPVDDADAQVQLLRLVQRAAPSRFTYLPGTAVHYLARGPVVWLRSDRQESASWRSMWSTATLDALRDEADTQTLVGAVQRDVHLAVVAWEADRICRDFYIDGRRPWRLSSPEPPPGPEPVIDDEAISGRIALTIAYSVTTADSGAISPLRSVV